jgi:hypothetical protein
MKLRIVQDRHAELQPWYVIQSYDSESIGDNHWRFVDAGRDLLKVRERFRQLITNELDNTPRYTLLEEADTLQ